MNNTAALTLSASVSAALASSAWTVYHALYPVSTAFGSPFSTSYTFGPFGHPAFGFSPESSYIYIINYYWLAVLIAPPLLGTTISVVLLLSTIVVARRRRVAAEMDR